MSTGLTVLIIAIVVIAIAVVVALAVRAHKQRQHSARMRLPELGALSGKGLDKQHAAAGHHRSTADSAEQRSQPPAGS